MTAPHSPVTSRRSRPGPEIWSACAAVAAVFAPVTLTGLPVVDAIERALVVGIVTFVGAHGRRWAWLTAAVAVTIPARGTALALALVALVVIVGAAWPKRRSRRWGAVGIGILLNAVFWYPADTPAWGPILALVAVATLLASGVPNLPRTRRRLVRWTLVGAVVLALVAGVLATLAMGLAYGSVRNGGNAARNALEHARDGDGPTAGSELDSARSEFEQASKRVEGPLTAPALLVPGLSQQVQAVQTTVDQGRRITAVGDDLVATADYDKLQYDGRLDLEQVRALAAPTRRADAALAEADRQVAGLGSSRLLPPLRDRLDQFSDDIAEARRDTALAARLLEVTPGLFGADGDRRYLVIALAPAELRGSGGFIGSYAELTAADGDVSLTRSGGISELITAKPAGSRTLKAPADYERRYGRFRPEDFLQDATLSPHFPSSAQVIADLYEQSGGQPVDGVIAVDPTGLAALLELTGPITVPQLPNTPVTADNAADLLNRKLYTDVSEAQQDAALTEITRTTFSTLIDSSLPSPRSLGQTLSPAARSGHLRVWSPDRGEERAFERLGADGSLALPAGGDGFSVVQQNVGNNKLDAYLQRTITYRPTVDAATGELRATMRIELHNGVPTTQLPAVVVDNSRAAPVGTNVASLTVFTRSIATKASIDGLPVQLGPSEERGLHAWDTPVLQIPPGKTMVIEITFKGAVDLADGYDLTILPQPVVNPDVFTATLTVAHGTISQSGEQHATLLDRKPLTAPTKLHADLQR